jgi:hypothetical protein
MPATIGFGAILADTTNADFTTGTTPWASVTNITFPAPETKKIDASHLGMSTIDMLYIPGLRDNKTVEVEQIEDPTERSRIKALNGVSPHYFKITHPNSTNKIEFSGFVCDGPSFEFNDGLAKMKTVIQISGPITLV